MCFDESGVKTEEIRKGRHLVGFKVYLDGIVGDPSLATIQGQMRTNFRTYKKSIGNTY